VRLSELPKDWKWVKISDVCLEIQSGSTPVAEKLFKSGEIQFLKVYNLSFDGSLISNKDPAFVSKELHLTDLKRSVAKDGDVLINIVGPPLGKVSIIRNSGKEFNHNQAIVHFRPNPNVLMPEFLAFVFQETNFKKNLIRTAKKTSGQANLKLSSCRDILVPLPPLETQNKVVEKVHSLFRNQDELRKKIDSAKTKLEVYRQSVLNAAIQGKLVPQDPNDEPASKLLARIRAEKETLVKTGKLKKEKPLLPIDPDQIPFEIPAGWEWVRLGDILSENPKNGYSPKGVDFETPYKVLTLSATTTGEYLSNKYKCFNEAIPDESDLWLQQNDILIQRGNTIDFVGIAALVTGNEKRIFPDLMIRIRPHFLINRHYIKIALNSPAGRQYVTENASGAQATMPKINQDIIRNWPIPLPPLQEQAKISSEIQRAWKCQQSLISCLEQAANKASDLKQSILKKAFEGNLL
jgi:type I restriction enzyme S subunit